MASDPATGQSLPDSAIQRVVFVASNVHVYGIPPLATTRGFKAGSWTAPPNPTAHEIFTARLRVVETSLEGRLKADIVLEDGGSGELFAAAPYTSAPTVQQAEDSSRFFALRVVGEGGMKATLGIGFEERSPALDFNIALGEMRKVLGWDGASASGGRSASGGKSLALDVQKDFSLKAGEKIHIEVGSKGTRLRTSTEGNASHVGQSDSAALFSIAPPPGAAKTQQQFPPIAPPSAVERKTAEELGFDDGEFGEFQ